MASVLDCLHYGKKNAVTREYLRLMTGLNDRGVRAEIRRLRVDERKPIFNTQDGSGYFLATPDDINEMKAACKIQDSRIKEDIELGRTFRDLINRVLNSDGSQMSL